MYVYVDLSVFSICVLKIKHSISDKPQNETQGFL